MATQVIDLTDDCSSDENTTGHLAGKAPTSELNPTQYSAVHLAQLGARRPLQSITTPNVSGKSPYSTTPRADMNPALIQAIDIAKVERLREMLKLVCRENQSSRELVEKHLLVPLDQVSQSDLDSESEEDEESVASSEASASEEDDDDEQIIQRRIRRLKEEEEHENFLRTQSGKVYRTEAEWREYANTHLDRDALAGIRPRRIIPQTCGVKRKASTLLPRFATCFNCKSEFDATQNEKGDCVWHWGEKEFDPDSHIWDDDDYKWERARELEDDPHYADGYMWNCCEKEGSAKGCKETKHTTSGRMRERAEENGY
jgi:hypothetical protein